MSLSLTLDVIISLIFTWLLFGAHVHPAGRRNLMRRAAKEKSKIGDRLRPEGAIIAG